MASVLIIDDEEFIRISLLERIEKLNHEVKTAPSLTKGIEMIKNNSFDLVFLDVNLPDGNGLEVLSEIKNHHTKPEVIIITAEGNSKGAEIAIKNGAWDYITKPFNKDEVNLLVKRSMDYRDSIKTQFKPVALKTEAIIGKSSNIKKAIDRVASCCATTANVLIYGETGTGKELFAKAVHDNDVSREGDYIVVDCAAMPESLTESILFGHVRGAFTGADKASQGLIKRADNGTLFLDEIGELPMSMQKAFLRVLQERRFRPVGSSHEVSSNFRLISATNRDLDKMVKEGKFREDLLHRLKTISLVLPPLRERKEDISILTNYYIDKICKKHSLKTKAFLPETLEILESYQWPGNVRELINSIEKGILAEPDLPILYPMFLPDRIRISYVDKRVKGSKNNECTIDESPGSSNSLFSPLYDGTKIPELKEFRESAISHIESLYFKAILKQTNWNIDKTAQISGISKSRVYYLIKKYNIQKI